MTLLSNLRDRIQEMLNDTGAGTWSTTTLEKWCNDAIRDYSQYFPRVKRTKTLISSATHEHSLPTDFISLIMLEYPEGEDPPAFLERRARTHDQFWGYEGYYDLEPRKDANDTGKFWTSEETANGEYFEITYYAPHDSSLASNSTVTVPTEHEFLIELYVIWTAFKERAATHLQDPDTTSDILQKMVNAEMQAHEEYRRAIRNAEVHRSEGGWTGPWRADIHDPIY